MKIALRDANPAGRDIDLDTRSLGVLVSPNGSAVGGGSFVYRQRWNARRAAEQAARETLTADVSSKFADDMADIGRFRVVARRVGTGTAVDELRNPLAYAFNLAGSEQVPASILRAHISLSLDYAGEAYLLLSGSTLVPLLGGTVEIVPAAAGSTLADGSPAVVAAYLVRDEDGRERARWGHDGQPLSGEAVGTLIRIHEPYPNHPYRAWSRVERAGLPIDVAHYARLATKAVLMNAGQPAGVLTVEDARTEDEVKNIGARINSYISDLGNQGKILSVSKKLRFEKLGADNPGSGWADLSQPARDDILSVWDMPLARLGRGGSRTYENQATELAQYYSAVKRRWVRVLSAINQHTRRMGFYLDIDTSGCPELNELRDTEVRSAAVVYTSQLGTLNEARQMVGLPPIEGGDTFYAGPRPLPTQEAPDQGGGSARGVDPFYLTSETPTPGTQTELLARAAQVFDDGWTRLTDRLEADLVKVAQAHHEDVTAEVLAAVYARVGAERADGDDLAAPELAAAAAFDVEAADARLRESLPERLHGYVRRVWGAVSGYLGVEAEDAADRWEQIATARVTALVTGRDPETGAQLWEGWNRSLLGPIDEALKESYRHGETVGQLAHRIREAMGTTGDTPTGARALTIARTEVNGLANASSVAAMEASGVVHMKAWYSISDIRSRPSHLEAAARYTVETPIPWDSRFEVGGVLMRHPHDLSAPARERVNCRCRLLPVVDL